MWRPDELPAIPRAERPRVRDFHRDYVERDRPLVLAGIARDWPAVARWTPAHLGEAHGDLRVSAYVVRENEVVIDPEKGLLIEEMSMREYVAGITAGEPRRYLRASMATLPRLKADLRTPSYCAGGLGLRSNLWFSAAGTVTRLHFDLPHNLIVQIAGKKRFILFPPRDSRALYRYPLRSSTPHASRVDPAAPDFARWPRLARARGVRCVLEPGDALFIPKRWWHHATSIETSVTVNHWWCDALTWPLLVASDLYKRARGLAI